MKRLFYYLILFFVILSCKHHLSIDDKTTYKEVLVSTADTFYQHDEYKDAIPYYDTLLSIYPSEGEYYFKRGYSKSMLLDLDGAIADYAKSILCNYSKKKSAYLNIGVIYANTGRDSLALPFLEKCLILDSTNAKAQLKLKEVLNHLKKQTQVPPTI